MTRAAASSWSDLAPMLHAASTTGYVSSVNECEQRLLACAVVVDADRDVVAVTTAVARLSRETPTVMISELQPTALAIERAYAGEVKFPCSVDSGKSSTSSRIRGTRLTGVRR